MSLQVPDNRSTLPIKKPVFQASTPAAKREEIKCGEDNFARVQRFHMAAKKLANDKAYAVVTRRAELGADVKKSRIHLVASLDRKAAR
jgi:hypothetical protein